MNRNSITPRYPDGTPIKTEGNGKLRVHSLAEYAKTVPVPEDWGPWWLDIKDGHAWLTLGNDAYYLDLSGCTTSAGVLDWIAQVAPKTWATPEVIAGLVTALNDILNLQGNLCGGGRDSQLTPERIRQMAKDKAAERERGHQVYPELLPGVPAS